MQQMSPSLATRLSQMREDYQLRFGRPFSHFYCPLLFVDEDTELCKAHVVNRGFPDSTRKWTVQRKDVDGFYGSTFEAEFEKIQFIGKHKPDEVLVDPMLSRKLEPKILLGGKPVDYFTPAGPVPEHFTPALVQSPSGTRPLVLKIHPDDAIAAFNRGCEILVERDMRLPTMVSLLKAAHLTLFHRLGYRYAMSAGGFFLGYSILGSFYLRNWDRGASEALAAAPRHFEEFANMVRPIQFTEVGTEGTVVDGFMFICLTSTDQTWAVIVVIRTDQLLHAVLVPVIDNAESAARFATFLKGGACDIRARRARLENDTVQAGPPEMLRWPKGGLAS
jgi:hypothetical protein